MKTNKIKALNQLGIVFLALIVINLISHFFFKRFDLTQDKRYTLSETTLNIIKNVGTSFIELPEGNYYKAVPYEVEQYLMDTFESYKQKHSS